MGDDVIVWNNRDSLLGGKADEYEAELRLILAGPLEERGREPAADHLVALAIRAHTP
jgi:hypothetical protein